MAKYKLVFRKSVSKDLRPIPKKDAARILQRTEALQEGSRPAGSEKLSGQERYRVRQGVYRIIYEVTDEYLVVTVVKVGHRQQIHQVPTRRPLLTSRRSCERYRGQILCR